MLYTICESMDYREAHDLFVLAAQVENSKYDCVCVRETKVFFRGCMRDGMIESSESRERTDR